MSKPGSPRRALSFFPGAEAAGGERSCSHEHGRDSILAIHLKVSAVHFRLP